ncbi:MAG: alpha/beta hydrolase family protein [Bacteroidales bacterium]
MKKIKLVLLSLFITFNVFAGQVDTIFVHSNSMDKDIKVVVITPNQNKAAINIQYPVVYMLHGAFGDSKQWLRVKPNLPELADEFGMIFVTPDALNSWYLDSPVNPNYRYETFVSSELMNYIDSHYNTISDRKGRGITGLSMGGHGALYLAMRHKEKYGVVCSMSGGVDFRPFNKKWGLTDILGDIEQSKMNWDDNVVINQIDNIKNGDLSIEFDCGESDFFINVNKNLHKSLLEKGIDHDFCTRPGAHNNKYWANSIDYQLVFLKKFFKKNHVL